MTRPIALLAILSLVAATLAGCLSGDQVEPAATTPTPPTTILDVNRPAPVYTELNLTAAKPDTEATLNAAPKLVPGEWWKLKFSSPLTGASAEFLRVVAAVNGSNYVIGMPHEGWYKEAVVYHIPCLGDVTQDLGCAPHNEPFVALQFPLKDGATWKTKYERPPDLTAKVAVKSPTVAEVTFTDPNNNVVISLTYDATVHEITKLAHKTAVYEVVEHGYGFEGWVTIPRGVQLKWDTGRQLTPATDFTLTPKAPIEKVNISGGYNRLSLVVATGGAGQIKVTAPNGTEYQMDTMTDPSKVTSTSPYGIYEYTKPDGDWSIQQVAFGPGFTYTEAVAYHQYDILLPSGAIRTDHSHPVIR